MPSHEQLAKVAREWILKAEEDLQSAAHLLNVRTLSIYGTVTRYPGDYEPITVKDARKAVSMARRVRLELRSLLFTDARTDK